MKKFSVYVLGLCALSAASCGTEMGAEQAPKGLVQQASRGALAVPEAGTWSANLHGDALDEAVWQRRPMVCSGTRNACTDPSPALTTLDGNGTLTLHATAGEPASADAGRVPARYSSLDLVAPEAAVVAGRCIEMVLTLPTSRDSYAGAVLTPAVKAPFLGQIYLASSTAGLLRMGLACADRSGSVSYARATNADFLAQPHVVRFCADAQVATWELDGELWGEMVAEELPDSCGQWPFGDAPSPLHPHLSVAPTGSHAVATEAASMDVRDIRVYHPG